VNRQNRTTDRQNQRILSDGNSNIMPASDFGRPPGNVKKFETDVDLAISNNDNKMVQPSSTEHSRLQKQPTKRTGKPARQVSLELTEDTIRRKTFSDSMQHPATMLPAAACLIAVGYLFLLSPMFGGEWMAIVIASISGVAPIVSFSIRYPKLFQKNTLELTEQFDIAREQMEKEQLNTLEKTINAGFVTVGSNEGLAVLEQLTNEYQQLMTSLGQQRSNDPLSVSVIPALVEETYRKGLDVLSDTLDLMNIVRTPGQEKLEKEIAQVESDIKLLKNDQTRADWLKLKEDVLATLKERLTSVNRLKLWVEQLLYQAQKCETTVHASRIELTTVRAGGTRSNLDSIIKVLEERIKQVKEVQDEIDRLGY
jgi:hypothetical protein